MSDRSSQQTSQTDVMFKCLAAEISEEFNMVCNVGGPTESGMIVAVVYTVGVLLKFSFLKS